MEIREYENFHLEEIKNLYQSVGWTNYLERIDILEEAYANSICVLGVYDDDRLIGIIRAVGDGKTIVFVQDIIVLPEYQRKGTPEMNPIEQIWKQLRSMGFRNEVFRTLECVIDRLCETIRSLTCEMVRSITSRQWIVDAFLEWD